MIDYWNACKTGLRSLQDEGLVNGYYATEELKLIQFLPTSVLPHIHAVVDAERFDQAALMRLEQFIKAQPNIELPDSMRVRSISTESDMYWSLNYLYKTLELAEPYRTAWSTVELNNRQHAWHLNSEVQDFMLFHDDITTNRYKMCKAGTLHPHHARYVGVKGSERAGYREYVDSIRQDPIPYAQEALA